MPPATYIYEQRTRLLTDPGRYVSTADARTLTGHTQPTLARLVDEGKLIARRAGVRTFSYQAASLLDYCRKQHPTLTLFDLLTAADGEPVTETELASELDRSRSGTWWTLARRDHAPPDWASWQHWYRGHTHHAQNLLFEQRPQWAKEIKEHRARGLIRRTLWMPAQPLGAFGEYGLARYQHVTAAGGTVHVLPSWKVTLLEHQRMLPDLEVTPTAVYLRRYTRVGSRNGALKITDPDLATATTAFLGWSTRQHSTPLADFARWRHQGAA
ncbi:hypothetical protein NE857_03355 [Nocardiopsis exhalans]|uniref:DUF6879 domain-containing protein n=1 Tax=Nocardiopsis exhalans TaxID=163604 RepID=A0ABY5D9N3_9ACTN|nr:DUF6879 family protein [Nocardiopsis exhalans]USY20707.1 hypothetical protein NE857_03355 [Nocardiopsis exhalans]